MSPRVQSTVLSLFALLAGTGILVMGNGLQGTLLAVRGTLEGFTTDAIGVVMAGYFLGFMAGSFFTVQLIDRAGHIRTFAALASIASAAALAHGVVIDEFAWGMLRAVSGFCFAGVYMVVESWLNERATNDTRGQILAIYMIINFSCMALGQFLLIAADPYSLIPFFLVSILVSLAVVPIALTRAEAPAPVKLQPASLSRLFAVSPLGFMGSLMSGLTLGAFWGLAPVFAGETGFGTPGIASFMAATIFGGLLFQWPLGFLSDRVDRRSVIAAACLLAGLVSVAIAFGAGLARPVTLGLAAVFGGLALPLYSLNVAHVNDLVEPRDRVSIASTLLLVYGSGATLGPIIAGVSMKAFGAHGLYLFTAASFFALGAFSIHRMARRAPVPVEAREAFVAAPRTTPVAYELDPRLHAAEGRAEAVAEAVAETAFGASDPE